jgi:hypothetical protein
MWCCFSSAASGGSRDVGSVLRSILAAREKSSGVVEKREATRPTVKMERARFREQRR